MAEQFALAALFHCIYRRLNPFAYQKAPQNPDPRTTDDKFMIEFISNDVESIKQLLIETGVEEISIKDA